MTSGIILLYFLCMSASLCLDASFASTSNSGVRGAVESDYEVLEGLDGDIEYIDDFMDALDGDEFDIERVLQSSSGFDPLTCEGENLQSCTVSRRGRDFEGVFVCRHRTRPSEEEIDFAMCINPSFARVGDTCGCCPNTSCPPDCPCRCKLNVDDNVSLGRPKGPRFPKGTKGPNGSRGSNRVKGQKGNSGTKGNRGVKGNSGSNGFGVSKFLTGTRTLKGKRKGHQGLSVVLTGESSGTCFNWYDAYTLLTNGTATCDTSCEDA